MFNVRRGARPQRLPPQPDQGWLVNQLTWAGLFWVTGAYISLVLCVVYGVMYARMIRKWRHDMKKANDPVCCVLGCDRPAAWWGPAGSTPQNYTEVCSWHALVEGGQWHRITPNGVEEQPTDPREA